MLTIRLQPIFQKSFGDFHQKKNPAFKLKKTWSACNNDTNFGYDILLRYS